MAEWEAKVSKVMIEGDGKIDVHIVFYPPDKRRRDQDGMLSSCKAYLDGIADGLEVNDSRFRLHLDVGDVVKGGQVRVSVQIRGMDK